MANHVPGFYFYPGDYLQDTQNLSEKSQVAYDRIMCLHNKYICISNEQLKFFTKRLNEEEKSELMMVLSPVEGGFQIPWVAQSIIKYKAYCDSRSKNKKGKIKLNEENTSTSYENHMEDEDEIEIEKKKLNGKLSKKAPVKTTTQEYFTPAKDTWFDFYKNNHPANGLSPSFDAVSGAKIKSLLAKLKTKTEESQQLWDQESAVHSFRMILETAAKMKWLKDNFSLKNIESQFDQIIQQALKINHASHSKGVTDVFANWPGAGISQG